MLYCVLWVMLQHYKRNWSTYLVMVTCHGCRLGLLTFCGKLLWKHCCWWSLWKWNWKCDLFCVCDKLKRKICMSGKTRKPELIVCNLWTWFYIFLKEAFGYNIAVIKRYVKFYIFLFLGHWWKCVGLFSNDVFKNQIHKWLKFEN